MEKKITLKDKDLQYTLRRSRRARRMRLTIYCDGRLVATVPQRFSSSVLEQFLHEKSSWILKKIDHFQSFSHKEFWKNDPQNFEDSKEKALMLAEERVKFYNQFYSLEYGKISIRNQRTRWGSCSRSGNLSFNYKIIFLDQKLADYIIVHELCHLQEFNHSKRFWSLVGKTMVDYKNLRKEVRRF